VATVQDMSGIRIDHFIRVDFNGFRTMTDALGGVQVCVPAPGLHDWRSHLNITAGLHVISGNEALAFVRDRHAIGNGGDLGRIRMQQMFISSLIKKVMSAGTLSDPVTLYRLANAATRSLTTDPGLGSVQALLGLAESLRSLKLSHITFVTLPTKLDPSDVNRLLPAQPATSGLWQLLRQDVPWSGRLPGATPAPRQTPAPRATTRPGRHGQPAKSPASPAASAAPSAAGVQTRNASENLCANLPTPNGLGEAGR